MVTKLWVRHLWRPQTCPCAALRRKPIAESVWRLETCVFIFMASNFALSQVHAPKICEVEPCATVRRCARPYAVVRRNACKEAGSINGAGSSKSAASHMTRTRAFYTELPALDDQQNMVLVRSYFVSRPSFTCRTRFCYRL